ncbi:MAG: S-methyl-5-thioribose-1-phosphate isomerase [Acidobacteria bacterium]|uniref:Methylthioribose-1-phosphate isomerase n=1 Tax=Candidatus Polarisedimenticola svalbardensis TaxID=2886004 RepID=A0A8J7CM79_9BACT|nr:S-methyl-5-thioribose-1-phosphate isomerase [Candidatus Polarisedimenticola svalbardensis]
MFITVERTPEGVRMIDQRRLPREETYLVFREPEEVAEAIRDMVVRGAPAIGVSAAFGLALGASRAADLPADRFRERMEQLFRLFADARPTAVNLFWAIDKVRESLDCGLAGGQDPGAIAAQIERLAQTVHDDDLESCRAIGRFGADLVPDRGTVLTHCNAGGLATAGYGTALGVIRGAVAAGKKVRVLADETRPFLQGARLTAWELMEDGIDTVLITDNMAGALMRRGEIDVVVVGSDRIAANGDIANKIGTYSVAVLAREHGIPFYVAAPLTTIDRNCPDGDRIPIEERDRSEVTSMFGVEIAPEGVGVMNPAFDVTPAEYIAGIVTDKGVARPPYTESLAALFSR